MTLKIIKQSTGLYAVFNPDTATIEAFDMGPDAVLDYIFSQDSGPIISWSDAIQDMRNAHGWEAVGEILDNLEREEPPGGL